MSARALPTTERTIGTHNINIRSQPIPGQRGILGTVLCLVEPMMSTSREGSPHVIPHVTTSPDCRLRRANRPRRHACRIRQEASPDTGSTPVAEATPVAGSVTGWPLYGNDLAGTRATGSADISSSNVADLLPLWQVEVGGPVSATPVIANGIAYVGSYDGSLYAIDLATGETRWTYETGAAVPEPHLQIPLGITGSATVSGNVI